MSDLPFGLSADPFALPATLTAEQTARLIENRVRACGGDAVALFPPETCAEIHRHAHGITGAVCDLAGKAMRIAAEAGAAAVSLEHVRAAAVPAMEGADQPDVAVPAPVDMATASQPDVVEPRPAPVDMIAAAPDIAAPDDDIPDLPAVPQGGFALPVGPSKDLAPDAQAWVSRFIVPEGPGAVTAAHARIPHPPATRDEPVPDPHALPKIPFERRRAAVSPLPPDSPHPERRAVVNFPRAASRDRPRERQTKVFAWATAATTTAIMVSLGAVVAHRLAITSAPPPGSKAERIAPARAITVAPATILPDSVPAAATNSPGRRVAALAASPGRAAISTRPAATPTGRSRSQPDAAPLREPQASAPLVSSTPRLALEIATFIFQDRAETERQRLAAAGYHVRVVTEWENGAPSYRVVLGSYSSRAAAERAADSLLGSGLIQQARIVASAGDR